MTLIQWQLPPMGEEPAAGAAAPPPHPHPPVLLAGAAAATSLWTAAGSTFSRLSLTMNVLAIVPFLYGGVVEKFHWLTEQQFVDAVAVAMVCAPGRQTIGILEMAIMVGSRLLAGDGARALKLSPRATPEGLQLRRWT